MNIKSFLLGSTAALLAVTGSRAADAITMVEPEPAEYVKICDTYGAGYFYIPGTETCLKIGGKIRARIYANDSSRNTSADLGNLNTLTNPNDTRGISTDDYNAFSSIRAAINFDAREETELGTVRTFINVQSDNGGANGLSSNFYLDNAFIQVGGLTVGKLDSLWATRDGLFTDNDWSVGDRNANRLSYTFASGGFEGTVSLEDDGNGDFVPDVVAQVAYTDTFGEAYLTGVYDSQSGATINRAPSGTFYALPAYNNTLAFNASTTTTPAYQLLTVYNGKYNSSDDAAFALKGGVTLKDVVAPGSSLKVEGSYAFEPTSYTQNTYLTNEYSSTYFGTQTLNTLGTVVFNGPASGGINLSTKYQIGAGYQQAFGKLTGYISGIYGETFNLRTFTDVSSTGVLTGYRDFGSAKFYGGAVNIGYDFTKNLSALAEVSYRKIDLPGGFNDFDETGGFLQLQRTF